jgi:hypothetical protein
VLLLDLEVWKCGSLALNLVRKWQLFEEVLRISYHRIFRASFTCREFCRMTAVTSDKDLRRRNRHAAGHTGSVARFRSYATCRLLDRDQPGSEVMETDCLDAVRHRIGFGSAIDNEAAGGFQVLADDMEARFDFRSQTALDLNRP